MIKAVHPNGNLFDYLEDVVNLASCLKVADTAYIDWLMENPDVVDTIFYEDNHAIALIILNPHETGSTEFQGVALPRASPKVINLVKRRLSRKMEPIVAFCADDNRPCRVMLNALGFEWSGDKDEHGQRMYRRV